MEKKSQEYKKNIFVDYRKAFDCIDHDKLEDLGMPTQLLKLVHKSESYSETLETLVQDRENNMTRLHSFIFPIYPAFQSDQEETELEE